jgi:hypothetical protein
MIPIIFIKLIKVAVILISLYSCDAFRRYLRNKSPRSEQLYAQKDRKYSKMVSILAGLSILSSSIMLPNSIGAIDIDMDQLPPLKTASRDEDFSQNVPNRKLIISKKDFEDLSPVESDDKESLQTILKLVPSYKYFKIISKEYSSRSTSYSGDDNLFAPFQ